jgi:predicted phage-related endonuclease
MKYQTINLQQGSPEWLAFRREHCTASEAPMMLGLHKNVKRSELLRMKKLGTEQEFSDYVQSNILDKGHEVEANARAILEKRLDDDLYPATIKKGKLSASLDGMTLDECIIFEHKQLNTSLIDALSNNTLPDQYMAQVQQQLMLTGADYCIFVCSDGTLDNWHEIIVKPDEVWFTKIRAGWDQFLRDLATYEPEEVKPEAVGKAIEGLPGVALIVSAEVKQSNLPAFVSAAERFIANIKTDLQTDQDFADAEETVKFCKKAEDQLEAAKANALAQTASLDEALRTIDNIKEQLRSKRLMLDKLVKTEKENRKTEMIRNAQWEYQSFVDGVVKELGYRPHLNAPDFAGAIKGKRNLASMKDAIDTLVANSKTELTIEAERLRNNLKEYHAHASGYEFLFNDLNSIIHHPIDALIGIIKGRIESHKVQEQARLDQERERIRAEEQRKLEAEQAKLRAAEQAKAIEPVKTQTVETQALVSPEPQTQTPRTENSARLVPESLKELDVWYERRKNNGLIPMSDTDADVFIWPLILEAYNLGKQHATKAA